MARCRLLSLVVLAITLGLASVIASGFGSILLASLKEQPVPIPSFHQLGILAEDGTYHADAGAVDPGDSITVATDGVNADGALTLDGESIEHGVQLVATTSPRTIAFGTSALDVPTRTPQRLQLDVVSAVIASSGELVVRFNVPTGAAIIPTHLTLWLLDDANGTIKMVSMSGPPGATLGSPPSTIRFPGASVLRPHSVMLTGTVRQSGALFDAVSNRLDVVNGPNRPSVDATP